MKNRLWVLVKGELYRLNKYNMTFISILVAFLWGVMLFFVNADILATLLPMVVLLDATMMALMYVGALMYFEKNESTISTMLVTPVSNSELLLSKLIANTLHNMFSSALIIAVFVLIKDVKVEYFLIFLGIFVSTAVFTLIGIVLAYFSKDFTGMLMIVMIFSMTFMTPVVLLMMGIIEGEFWEVLLLLNPIESAREIISGGFTGYAITYKYYLSLGYLTIGGVLLYIFYALPKFQDYAIKQSGV
ncbi:MAG: hypothetical protein KAH16_02825 [Candidatus Izimaplasma sp.]|nr:hypothetical protein [Candidatus Izimaplasma bacterium]